ncbi:NAD(P)-dependent oxidoreductase [Kitasatospora sp. NPDC051853]|uniref:NAD(P)-dependent oxidoreductase n=1 Tax=Kitasatospora sp. NPDC051853 TaxID=3364058 RepID=UPI0037B5AECC
MRITVFAATGGIGRLVLEQAVAAGHEVTAAVRSPERLAGRGARVVGVDLAAPGAELLEAVAGADVVLSALGARGKGDIGVAERGTRAIAGAMSAAGVRRLLVVSAGPIGTVPSPDRPRPPRHDPGDDLVTRRLLAPLVKAVLRERYADLARMEDVVRASGLDWTVVRPPRLTDRPLTGRYRTALERNVRGGTSVSRADVAHCMLDLVDSAESVGRTVAVAS